MNQEAIELRERFGFNSLNPIDLKNIILEELPNITLIFQPISDKTSGICINKDNVQIICINSEMNLGRQRFTLAHELYHLLVEKNFKLFLCNDNNQSDSEMEANIFASFLLMPDEALASYIEKNNITKFDINAVIRLEQYFQIGHYTMLIRLKQNHHITESELQDFMKIPITHESANMGFSTELYDFPLKKEYKVYGKYINLINELDLQNIITPGEKQELLLNAFRGDLVYNMQDDDEIEKQKSIY